MNTDARYSDMLRKDDPSPKGFRTNPARVARSHRASAGVLKAKALYNRLELARKAKLKQREGL
jgi:hypothetical protein